MRSTDANCAHHRCKRFTPQMQTARTTNANDSLHRCKVVRQTQQSAKTVAMYFSMSLCSVSANCSRLRCKTGCSTDARLSNVVHCIVSLQFAIQLRFSSFFHCVAAPIPCLGPLDLSPYSLGLSSSTGSGRCSSCALSCAVQGRMSACRTRPAANPGGPQGGAQTGRSPGGGGGGGWTEAEPSRLRNQMLRGFPRYPARTFSALRNGHTETLSETRIQKLITNYKCTTLYNHIYNCLFMCTINHN